MKEWVNEFEWIKTQEYFYNEEIFCLVLFAIAFYL